MTDPRRSIPSVDAIVASDAFLELIECYGRPRAVRAARAAVEYVRAQVARGDPVEGAADVGLYAVWAAGELLRGDVPSLRAVINATGVVLHTNLGRAPIAAVAAEAMAAVARGYSNLEYDIDEGTRGSRYDHCVDLLCELTGADDALVVNNNAAALVLALNTVARGAGVVVSRGELVEIGGGFRIPDILERSGARLVEVGSTNRTRLADYRTAIEVGGVAAILKVHRSNFHMTGFTEEVSLSELAGLAKESGIPLLHDLGSGLLVEADRLGLPEEPRPQDSLAAGTDLVAVSGDKLMGGPQAGILLGGREMVAALRENPLCRALRVDKVTLAGVEATLRLYRDGTQAVTDIPTLRMLAAPPSELEARAQEMVAALAAVGVQAVVRPGQGAVGGGTYPGATLAGATVVLGPGAGGADGLAGRLRTGDPPVIVRILDDCVVIDPRTVLPGQEEDLTRRVAEASRPSPEGQ